MNHYSAPRPDGFGAYFFQKYCDVVCHGTFLAFHQFFVQGWIFPYYNSNVFVLIPKFIDPSKMEHCRPIALANFKFKIITKVLAYSLATTIPHIISPQQRGFIQGWYIGDCILGLCGKFGSQDCIRKNSDTIDWTFLSKVLHAFRFKSKFCH